MKKISSLLFLSFLLSWSVKTLAMLALNCWSKVILLPQPLQQLGATCHHAQLSGPPLPQAIIGVQVVNEKYVVRRTQELQELCVFSLGVS
jgi:hypothetical protein